MSTDEPPLKRTGDTIPGLWRYYEEHASQARQHENLRATVTSILSATAAAVVGLASIRGINKADLPAGFIVVLLALLGIALNIKHYERNRLHTTILEAVRNEITRLDQDETAAPKTTQEIRREAEDAHNSKFRFFSNAEEKSAKGAPGDAPAKPSPWTKIRLHILWLGLPVSIGVVGVLVIVLAFVGVAPAHP
jgi:hypothetical protein